MARSDPETTPAARVLAEATANPASFAERAGITPEQVLNLVTLARYLRALPADYAHFEMDAYMSGPAYEELVRGHTLELWELPPVPMPENRCGTAACAAGHGPTAGIDPIPEESWDEYALRVFGESGVSTQAVGSGKVGLFRTAFDGHWSLYDNTPHGAAARIAWWLSRAGTNDHFLWAVSSSVREYQEFME